MLLYKISSFPIQCVRSALYKPGLQQTSLSGIRFLYKHYLSSAGKAETELNT